MRDESTSQTWVWDRYWQADRVASCFAGGPGNYPEKLVTEWQEFFKSLPEGANILDLCTGNGAIARIAAKTSVERDRNFSVIAVDQAKIDPETFVTEPLPKGVVEFKGGISAEDLPFEEDSFDAVVSQYGFEYTKTDVVAGEFSEILKPGGAGKMICHAEEGTPAANARREIETIGYVVDDLDLYQRAEEATALAWKAEKAPPEEAAELVKTAKEKIAEFTAAMGKLAAMAKDNPDNLFLTSTFGLLKHTFEVRQHFPLEPLIEKISDTKTEALAHLGRIEALLDSSLSEKDCRALVQIFQGHGFSDVKFAPFYLEEGAKLVGWNFEFHSLAK